MKRGEGRYLLSTTYWQFLCSPKGEHIVAVLSFSPSVRHTFVRSRSLKVLSLFVQPSLFCPEHISKSIEGNLMKLDTLIEGHEWNCRMQKP